MTFLRSLPVKHDGDDDDTDATQQPLQGQDTGVMSGDYAHPDYIPGETAAADHSQL